MLRPRDIDAEVQAGETLISQPPLTKQSEASRAGIEAWEARAMAGMKRVYQDEATRKANIPNLS